MKLMSSLPGIHIQLLADAITSEYATVKIIDRHPKSGNPSPGVPLGITVQVQTDNSGASWFRTPFKCVDAFVAVRDYHSKEVVGGEFILTSFENNCRGTGRINLGNYRPGKNSLVQLELYEGGSTEWFSSQTTIEDVKNADVKPIQVSNPFSLYMDYDKAKEAGLISNAETSLMEQLSMNIGDSVNKLILALGIGVGAYLVVPMIPNFIEKFKNADS